MASESQQAAEAIWVKAHLNRKGNWVKGHWRTRPRTVRVKGYFRSDLGYVKPYKRRKPTPTSQSSLTLGGQPSSFEETMINILRDVEPLMGY